MGHHCDWCGNARTECECEERDGALLAYGEKAVRSIIAALEDRRVPRLETVALTGSSRGGLPF